MGSTLAPREHLVPTIVQDPSSVVDLLTDDPADIILIGGLAANAATRVVHIWIFEAVKGSGVRGVKPELRARSTSSVGGYVPHKVALLSTSSRKDQAQEDPRAGSRSFATLRSLPSVRCNVWTVGRGDRGQRSFAVRGTGLGGVDEESSDPRT
jgi:hypothetical protein